MKVVAKILKTVLTVLITLIAVLFVLSLFLQNRVGEVVLQSLNNTLQTRIETESYRLSLIRKFPKATVQLRNIYVHSSPGFDITAFPGINTDTLLKAKSASVDFRMLDLVRGAYTFTRVGIKNGELNLFTDPDGKNNYSFSKNEGKPGKSLTLSFNRINTTDLKFCYNDRRPNLLIKGVSRSGHFKSRIKNDNIDFEGNSDTRIDHFSLRSFTLPYPFQASIQSGLNSNKKGIFFRRSTMRVENWDFVLNGFIASDDFIDLSIKSGNIDISKIANLLPEKQQKALALFDASGSLKFDCTIKGKSTRTEDPHYDISWSLDDAMVRNRKSNLKLEKLSFEGSFTNGQANSPATSVLSVNTFRSRLGSSDYSGSLLIKNLREPEAELVFKGRLLPAELKEFLNLTNISRAGGSIDLDLKFAGSPKTNSKFRIMDILNLNSNSEILLNSVGLKIDSRNATISDANGKIILNRNVTSTDNVSFFLNGHRAAISGKLENLPGWLAGNNVNLTGSANIVATCFKPESFMTNPGVKEGEKDKSGQNSSSIKFPDDIMVDVNYRLDTLEYKTFRAENITGSLSTKPGMIIIRNVNLNSQKGKISGNGLVVQNRNKSFTGKGSFAVTGIDVHEAFTTFNNFGQNFLKAENLAGSLSGSISLLLPADSLLNPDVRSITAEGRYSISDGSLINFDPVKALSKFISLSELENIKFDKLENDFFIRNNVFYVPQMDIKSSAANLSVNGKHSFDNDYEYHVKMHLSEILSRKARKNKVRHEEFGEVADDGLGRISIFLLVDGKGENVDVSYDMKAQGTQIKDNLKKEKENLKTIFNEEYGLYDRSSDPGQKKESKPRFRIRWDDSPDDVIEEKDDSQEKRKETFLDRLFKKN